MINLDNVINTAYEIEPLPPSATRLVDLLMGHDWELSDIAEIVRLDPALTGRVLGMANSVAYRGGKPIVEVRQALMRLGSGAALGLAIGSSAKKQLQQSLPAFGLSEGMLWRHSVAVAVAVENLGRYGHRIPPEAFTAALMHDIGKLVLGRHMRPDMIDFVNRSLRDSSNNVTASEVEILEVHHGEVGGLIAEHWELPQAILEGIAFHHDPQAAPSEAGRRVCELISFGDSLARLLGYGDGEPVGEETASELADRMVLTESQLQDLCDRLVEGLDGIIEQYG